MTQPTPTTSLSFAAPLGVPIFRALWIVALVSNIGTWMQTVGAQWLLIQNPDATALVPLVQTASSLPVLLLALPAGVLGEFVNRRSVLIGAQGFQVLVGLILTVLTAVGGMSPLLLLALTFLIGVGSAIQLPAYQALVPDIVPRPMIANAAALSSISVNIARAIGPALAGLAIAQLGVPFVFGVNTLTFLAFLAVLVFWRGYHQAPLRPEPFVDAARAGLRYVRNAPVVRRILFRLFLFIVPANALWALLPLVAQRQLGLDSAGYGVLLAAVGVGSIAGAVFLPRLRGSIGINRTTLFAAIVFGLGLVAVAVIPWVAVTIVILVVVGVAWIAVIASLNSAVQTFLPVWVRSRGLSAYQIVLFGGTALGSALAGLAAQYAGILVVNLAAGILLLAVAASQLAWPLMKTNAADRSPAPMPLPEATFPPPVHAGETLVLISYTVDAAQVDSFLSHAAQLESTRRRTGARRWNLYREREESDVFTEAFTVGSWAEHLSQHDSRQTAYDRDVIAEAKKLSRTEPLVRHLLATQN